MIDSGLIEAMRHGEVAAWGLYEARYRPILEAYARRAKIPPHDWPICISEVLEDEAIRLTGPHARAPINLAAYLVAAVHHRYLRLKRANLCRERNYGAASEVRSGEWVVSCLCSEDSLRASDGPDGSSSLPSEVLARLITEVRAGLTPEEESILIWLSERVPHSQIARWLGSSYDACTKRIWRLCRRLRSELVSRAATYPSAERAEIDRFMRRVAVQPANGAAASRVG